MPERHKTGASVYKRSEKNKQKKRNPPIKPSRPSITPSSVPIWPALAEIKRGGVAGSMQAIWGRTRKVLGCSGLGMCNGDSRWR